MAKAALLDVLQQTIGKYVKNLDPESLSVAVWSGKIELNSLELDVESINVMLDKKAEEAPNLAMPFKVLSGHFESFQVDVPWSQITSRPVVLRAQGLSVAIEPLDRSSSNFVDYYDTPDDYDTQNTKRVLKQNELREQQINEHNSYRVQAFALKKIALAAENDNGNGDNTSTFASRLVRRIIENIQIVISNVHVSLRNDDYSAGVVLESLKFVPTDSHGREVYVDRTGINHRNSSANDINLSFLYKSFQIQGLGIYLDEDEFRNARKSLQSVTEDGMSVISDNSSIYSRRSLGHSFVLAPLSFQTSLRIADKTLGMDDARYELRSSLSVLSFLLTRSQVDIVQKLGKIMSSSNYGPNPLFPEYRPIVLVKGHAKEWWKYACRCIGRMNGKRLWIEFFQAYKKRRKYIPLYKRHSHNRECSWVKPLDKDELRDLLTIEQDRCISIQGLMEWRNIADAQIDKEREKKKSFEQVKTSSMFSYVFGSRALKTVESDGSQSDEEPAIILSVEEMKELESISRIDFTDSDAAKDSLLYDVEFVLDAMKIDLVGYDMNHLALLDMGKVTIDFDATADGAFTTSFDLYDLEVFDRITPNSLFPSVLKKLDSGLETDTSKALHLDVSKSATGDQSLVLKTAEFQLVASKMMAQELRQFFNDSSTITTATKLKSNPMLQKSLSGSVDLFYDATQGDSHRPPQLPHQAEDGVKAGSSPEVTEMLSNKLVDVWKKKSLSKVSWLVDIDIKAPIVLIPEVCNCLEANVMVFDLGNLKVKYGKGDPIASLQQWFDEYPRDSLNDERFETGTISINDLTFSVQKASFWHTSCQNNSKECAIIDPIGVGIDFAVEDIGPEFETRSCFLGVIPTISLKLSYVQLSQVFQVTNSWINILSGERDDIHAHKAKKPIANNLEHDYGYVGADQLKYTPSKQNINSQDDESNDSVEKSYPMVYCKIKLQCLTVMIMEEGGKNLEAHLVSVHASVSQSSDESSLIRLTMGWFFILDWMEGCYARKQRLLIHSKLPRSAESFSERNEYNVIEELTKEGVFEEHYSGSTELADVSFKTFAKSGYSSPADCTDKHPNSDSRLSFKSNRIRYMLDAKFRSLVIHWNPHAIKEINSLFSRFLDVFPTAGDSILGDDSLVLNQTKPEMVPQPDHSRKNSHEKVETSDSILIIAEMESLGVVLNSARDDLPLFMLTVSGTQLSIVPRIDGREISLSLGDLRVATSETSGKTLFDYRTLLGLEDSSMGSLLTIKYYEGRESIETLCLPMIEKENFTAIAIVELSPMRFCYIQSQAMTLINYITEGILGAITAKAAISAAEAAKELASSVSGHYFFSIRATSFEAIIPEAAYLSENIRLKTASLSVDYYLFSDNRGSDIRISLSNLMVKGNFQKDLQESPIHLSLDVKMPLVGVGSLDDQAMKVNAEISKAKFILAKDQYSQIMNTLETNFSETALFLREDDFSGKMATSAKETHSGVQLDESTQRIYFILDIKEVSLLLNGRDQSDPLVRLTAIETTISIDMIPDLDKFSVEALLQNLVCEDCRLVASSRQSRFLIDRSKHNVDVDNKDIFQIKYCREHATSNIDLKLGSPQIVFFPDLISEVLQFVGGAEKKPHDTDQPSTSFEGQDISSLKEERVQIDSFNEEEIETNLSSSNVSVTNISAKTGTCRFVLMNLGRQFSNDKGVINYEEILDPQIQLTETVVIQGIFVGSLSVDSIADSGNILSATFQCNSDTMEVFTAIGNEMKCPLQILEPASASIHGSLKSTVVGDTEIEIRAASLTSIDFSLSIHNAALLMDIIDSFNDSFRHVGKKQADQFGKEQCCLTLKEQEEIEKLATALENTGHRDTSSSIESGSGFADSRTTLSQQLSVDNSSAKIKVQIKATMPQATITFINDLLGMDEALFRVSMINFVAGGNMISPTTLFDFHCNTSILADYFDASVNLWSRLLIKPWELTIKGCRTSSHRFQSRSHRLSSSFDLESFPCWISFSEQFLVSLASAARMWSIYSAATSGLLDKNFEKENQTMTTSAKKLNLMTSFPNAISNHSGIDIFFSLESGSIQDRTCVTECTQYFRFDPPKGAGYGGTRVYGQDVEVPKNVEIKAEGSVIVVNMDYQLGLSACAHEIGDKLVLYTRVVKEGKTTVLHLRSHVELINQTLIPFNVQYLHDEEIFNIGKCSSKNSPSGASENLSSMDGIVSKKATNFSIPIPLLFNFQKDWQKFGKGKFTLRLRPLIGEIDSVSKNCMDLWGEVSTHVSLQEMRRAPNGQIKSNVEVTCRRKENLNRDVHPLTLRVVFTMKLLAGEHVIIDVSLEPRSVIENRIPLPMKIRTPMPRTFSTCQKEEESKEKYTTYCVNPNERVEIYTPGPSIAIMACTRDKPIAGHELGWVDGGWVDLPLIQEFRLQDPIISMLPIMIEKSVAPGILKNVREPAAEFFIVEGEEKLSCITDIGSHKLNNTTPISPFRTSPVTPQKNGRVDHPLLLFILTVCNYGVDHTGSILFEQESENGGKNASRQPNRSLRTSRSRERKGRSLLNDLTENLTTSQTNQLKRRSPLPFGAFSSPIHRRRISLLPNSQCPIQLLQMTIDGTEGYKRTMPFMIENLPIGDGGVATVPIVWENQKPTGLFAYRRLINEHQSEIHVVPEFIIFNGSGTLILVKEKMMPEIVIESGETGQLRAMARVNGTKISINFNEFKCRTAPLSVAKPGLKVAIIQSLDGVAIGSVYIQTVIDTRGDSRLVIKIGEIKFGSHTSPVIKEKGMFSEDFCRFRIRWTELQIVLNEVGQKRLNESWNVKTVSNLQNVAPTIGVDKPPMSLKLVTSTATKKALKQEPLGLSDGRKNQILKEPIMAVILSRFTVDFQRVFKDERTRHNASAVASTQRSQISIIVHKIQIKDLTPDSHYPMVFDCDSEKSVFDLCIRIRGPLNADLVKVDLFDLNLVHEKKSSEKMTLTTSEDYVWRILDLVNRILAASGEVSGFSLKCENDDEDNYVIKIQDAGGESPSKPLETNQYSAPAADTLYDIALARVSPFAIVVSFRRSPELARYKKVHNAPGAALTNYFTRKLKFTIDKAELNFTRYEDRTLKGPLERLLEVLSTVYVGRMKFKVVSLLSAASLQDWRYLAARDGGDDEYIEGDILRATGNLAGKSAGLVVQTVGHGVSGAVAGVSTFVGEGIENGTSKIGARRFGSGVNSVVTGMGYGVGDTVSGVGTGASKILRGAGQGVGHIFGGVSGGALQIGKGIGKGIATGDGRAFVEGVSKGASSVGGGIAQGAGSAVMGTADGLLSAGKGIFSGFKSVGQGFESAFTGKKSSNFIRQKKAKEKRKEPEI